MGVFYNDVVVVVNECVLFVYEYVFVDKVVFYVDLWWIMLMVEIVEVFVDCVSLVDVVFFYLFNV